MSKISDEVFINILKKLNVNGNICDLLEKYFEFLNKDKKYTKDFDSKCEVYKDIIQEGKDDYIHNILNMQPIHEELSKLDLNKTQMDFDGTS